MEFNLADMFEDVADHVGDREAVVADKGHDRVRLTYRQLDERANRLAHHLADQGIGPGDHVGCHMRNGNEYLETMLACFKLRAVPINVNYRYVEEEIRYLYTDADLKATVVQAEYLPRVEAVRGDLELLEHVVVVDASDSKGTVGYEDALADSDPGRGFGPRSADDLMMIYTGGTTGMPKGVMWRHEDIFQAGMMGGNAMGEPHDRPEGVAEQAASNGQLTMFPVAPLMHGAAQLASFIAFWGGHRVILIRDFSGPAVLRLVEEEKANTLSIVGDAMAMPIVEALEEGEYDTSSLLALGSAGAILSQSTRDRLTAHLPDLMITDAFGASEVGYTGSATEGSSPESGLKFQPNDRTAVVDDELRIISPGSDDVGRVAQRGFVPLGYYKDEKKTRETFVEIDGVRWVLLGDQARIDADGVIHFLGRGSVCINSGGEKIYPEEVEAAIKSHDAVQDVVVAGIPDERWGQSVAAVLTVRPGETLTPDELDGHLEGRIARYKLPRFVHIADEIKRSPSGKCDYTWARDVLTAAAARTVGA